MDRTNRTTAQKRFDSYDTTTHVDPFASRVYSSHRHAPRGSIVQDQNNSGHGSALPTRAAVSTMTQTQGSIPRPPEDRVDPQAQRRSIVPGSTSLNEHGQRTSIPPTSAACANAHQSQGMMTGHVPVPDFLRSHHSAQYPTAPPQASHPELYADTWKEDVVKMRALLIGIAITDHNYPIDSFADLERMELAFLNRDDPAQNPDLYADFQDDPPWLKLRAQRLVAAMTDLEETEDREQIVNRESVAVAGIKAKKPIELLMGAWKMLRSMLKAQKMDLALPQRCKIAHFDIYTDRLDEVEACLKANKLLVRSCFENDAWIDRIAANPVAERKKKMQNENNNGKQHNKIAFAADAKKQDPTICFDKFERPAKRARRTSTCQTDSALPQSPAAQHSTQKQSHDQERRNPSNEAVTGAFIFQPTGAGFGHAAPAEQERVQGQVSMNHGSDRPRQRQQNGPQLYPTQADVVYDSDYGTWATKLDATTFSRTDLSCTQPSPTSRPTAIMATRLWAT